MTQPLPFKLRAMYALTDIIKEVTPANGYRFDMADFVDGDGVTVPRVYRGRAWFGDSDPIPMVSILEGANPFDITEEAPMDTAAAEYDWNLSVQVFVDDDKLHPTDPAYLLLDDIRKRLVLERRRKMPGTHQPDPLGLGAGKSRIYDLRVRPGVVRPADDISSKAYGWLTVTLRIVDNAEAG